MSGYYVAANGDRWAYEVEGDSYLPPVLWLHGFTGSRRVWDPVVADLCGDMQCVTVDILGHGESDAPAAPARYGVEPTIAALNGLMAALGHETYACVGYSMGGRIALALAATSPARVTKLVLESASPGLEDEADRQERAVADEELADDIERAGLARFVQRWEQLPLFSTQAKLPPEVLRRQRAIRLSQRTHGLAGSLRGIGTGAQPSYWTALHALPMPVRLLTGDRDAKFTGIATRMQACLPSAVHCVVPAAGHAVHLEQPETYARLLQPFLLEKGD